MAGSLERQSRRRRDVDVRPSVESLSQHARTGYENEFLDCRPKQNEFVALRTLDDRCSVACTVTGSVLVLSTQLHGNSHSTPRTRGLAVARELC